MTLAPGQSLPYATGMMDSSLVRYLRVLAIGCGFWATATSGSMAAEPQGADPMAPASAATGSTSRPKPTTQAAAIAHTLSQLDSERYDLRIEAQEQLLDLLDDPQAMPILAREVAQLLRAPATSYEVRLLLEPLLPRLSAATAASAGTPDPHDLEQARGAVLPASTASELTDEINALIRQLDADSFAQRLNAQERLRWLCTDPSQGGAILSALKAGMTDTPRSPAALKQCQRLWTEARRLWLLGKPDAWQLPPLDETQLRQWAVDLTASASSAPEGVRPTTLSPPAAQRAYCELVDALCRDEYCPLVTRILQEQLRDPQLSPASREQLTALLDWTRPAMVAECWNSTRHTGIQHLLIGVPNKSAGAARASLFDRCDDRTAHCVSGNSLTPGDYPVGIFFPHPHLESGQFHLVHLPTPRRRMHYELYCESDEAERLAAITHRTCAALLAGRQPLTSREILMMLFLDRDEVSHFAGQFMQQVADTPEGPRGEALAFGEISQHARLCHVLAAVGTKAALPSLRRAIEQQRITPPSPEAPFHLPWIAVLSIQARDPSDEGTRWLAGLVERTDALVVGVDEGPELGASAAGLLLEQAGLERASLTCSV